MIPLTFKSELVACVLVGRSGTQKTVNWEDRDLLKMAGKQAAVHFAQYQTDKTLMERHQFESFNRLSAYVVHDLKNILAQQSLLLSNAEKHKSNPDFVDDVFLTIANSVERMERLMGQMRSGVRGSETVTIRLSVALQEVVDSKSQVKPVPRLTVNHDGRLETDPVQLKTVFSHIIQNAQEATEPEGQVTISLDLIRELVRSGDCRYR